MAEERTSLNPVGRLGGALFTPGRTFESIAARPTWVLPLLLWTLVTILVSVPMTKRIDLEGMIRQQIARTGQPVSESKVRESLARAENFRSLGVVAAALGPAAVTVFFAALFWLLWKLFGSDVMFVQTFGVTTHAFLPSALGGLLLLPPVLSRAKIDPRTVATLVRSNLSFLTDPVAHPVRASLLQSFDIFSLWTLALLVVGVSAATRTPRARTATVLIVLWILYIAVRVGWVAFLNRAA